MTGPQLTRTHRVPVPAERHSALDRLARRLLTANLECLEYGVLRVVEAGRITEFGRDAGGPRVTVNVRHPSLYRRMLLGGNLGLAEAYMEGLWDCDDLVGLCGIGVRNDHLFNHRTPRLEFIIRPVLRLLHARRRNTHAGARRNIAAHYDLSNDFYRLFLDDNMMYSSAIYPSPGATLEEAAAHKIDRICRKLDLQPGDRVLEIGTGWGGFALQAVRDYGCHITTTTISDQQYELARQRIARAGLEDRIELLKTDYRDLTGQYDKIVSIEMIEAIGHQYLDTYFGACSRLLKPDGLMLFQGITVAEWAYERHKRSVDFIKRHIFPGSSLIAMSGVAGALGRSTDLNIVHLEDIGPHYARTLHAWRERFLSRLDEVRALGFSDTFIRMWDFYLASCEAGFAERYTADWQVVLAKPLNRRAPILPALDSAA